MKLTSILKAMVPMVLGVIVAGFVLKWGHENDIPLIKDAAAGFDQ